MKSRHQVFDIEIYRHLLVVVDSKSPKYANKLMDEAVYEKDETLFGHAIYTGYKGKSAVFLVVDSTYDIFEPSVIAHEAVHCANMIFQSISYDPKVNNDEVQACLVELIFQYAFNYIYGQEGKR